MNGFLSYLRGILQNHLCTSYIDVVVYAYHGMFSNNYTGQKWKIEDVTER